MNDKKEEARTSSYADNISDFDEALVESILAEARQRKEKSEMARVASKYKPRPKMDEIFSNTSRERRYTNTLPTDDDIDKTAIADEQTATTIKAEILMDSPDMPGEEKTDAQKDEPKEKEEIVEITLTPEYEQGTQISGEVIDDIKQLDLDFTVPQPQPDVIDIDLSQADVIAEDKTKEEKEDEKSEEKAEETQTKPQSRFEEKFGISKPIPVAKTVVSKVPVYIHDSRVEKINVKAGKFSQVVASEYEQYVRSKDPTISKTNTPVRDEKEDKTYVKSINEKIVGKMVDFFSAESDDYKAEAQKQKTVDVDDYEKEQDAKSISAEIKSSLAGLFLRSVVMGILVICSVVLTVMLRVSPSTVNSAIPAAPVICSLMNLLMVSVAIFTSRVTVFSGLSPLIKLRGNSDTALAVAATGAAMQSVVSLFTSDIFFSGALSLYSVIVIVAFFANTLGKYLMVKRVNDNFKYVASRSQKYSAKIYTDEQTASKIMNGAVVGKPIIAYQHKTKLLSNFLKLSYAPDKSEEVSGRLAPFTTLSALLIAIVYGVVFKSFAEAISVFALVTAVSIPVCNMLVCNLPLKMMSKKLLRNDAMISGYPAVKQFCDSAAVMIDARDLYPEGCIKLDGIKTFVTQKIDDDILSAAAVLKAAESPMASVFSTLLEERRKKLPHVESVLYEDSMGLVGWVNNERVLIGNHELLEKYSVDTPSADYEERYRLDGKQITYLAKAGQLLAMLVTTYAPDIKMAYELQNAEDNGLSVVVTTTDCNITGELIAEQFGVFYRSVRVLPIGLGNVCKEACSKETDKSRAYLSTKGKATSLLNAVSTCVKIRGSISLAVAVQTLSVIFGIVLAVFICLYAGVAVVQTVEIFVFSLFWSVATVIASIIRKPRLR